MKTSHRHLIAGMSRKRIAAALWEYRQFAANHPGDPLAAYLLTVSRHVHSALHERRRIERAIS